MEGLVAGEVHSGMTESLEGHTIVRATFVHNHTPRILIIERDTQAVQALVRKLTQAGFTVTTVDNSEQARAAIDHYHPHLVMLDWELPHVIAMGLIRHVRPDPATREPRLIALSSFGDEEHVVSGFELGIDDYVVKPFSIPEVIARVRAVLRPSRALANNPDCLEFRQMRLQSGRVTVNDCAVSLRSVEFRLLEFLMRQPERAFPREMLLNRVWGRDCQLEARVVDLTIQRIRRALEPHGYREYVQTVRGIGYRLSASAVMG